MAAELDAITETLLGLCWEQVQILAEMVASAQRVSPLAPIPARYAAARLYTGLVDLASGAGMSTVVAGIAPTDKVRVHMMVNDPVADLADLDLDEEPEEYLTEPRQWAPGNVARLIVLEEEMFVTVLAQSVTGKVNVRLPDGQSAAVCNADLFPVVPA